MTDPEYTAAIETAREQGAQSYKEFLFKAIEMFCELPDGALREGDRIIPVTKGYTHTARQLKDYLNNNYK